MRSKLISSCFLDGCQSCYSCYDVCVYMCCTSTAYSSSLSTLIPLVPPSFLSSHPSSFLSFVLLYFSSPSYLLSFPPLPPHLPPSFPAFPRNFSSFSTLTPCSFSFFLPHHLSTLSHVSLLPSPPSSFLLSLFISHLFFSLLFFDRLLTPLIMEQCLLVCTQVYYTQCIY